MYKDTYQPLPEEFEEDLNPDNHAGEHHGIPTYEHRPAFERKELHDRLQGFSDDELKAIPVLVSGSRLEQGAIYLDLMHPEKGPFRAMGDMEAGNDNAYVPKREIDYVLWNRLTGVENPERLDRE